MVRPCKCRKISINPNVLYFKPRGIPLCSLEEVCLNLDEVEAMRLADFEGMYQEDAAIQLINYMATKKYCNKAIPDICVRKTLVHLFPLHAIDFLTPEFRHNCLKDDRRPHFGATGAWHISAI